MSDLFRLSDFLPYRLAVLSERVSRRLSVEYDRTHGLAVAEWRVLVHLLGHGAVSVRDIQTAVNLEKPRVSRAVTRLEADGMVSKDPVQGDGRLVAISLTPKGRAALDAILPAALEVQDRLIASVSKADLATFFRVAEAMHATLDQDPKARPRTVPGKGKD